MCVFKALPLEQVAQTSGGAPSLEVFQAGLGGAWSNLQGVRGRGNEMSSEEPFSPERSEFL